MNQQPPEEVPEGLSAHEYQRLIALYTLMGRHNHAAKAFSKLSEVQSARRTKFASDVDGVSSAADQFIGSDQVSSSSDYQFVDGSSKVTDAINESDGDTGDKDKEHYKDKDKDEDLKPPSSDGANFAQALMKLLQQLTREEVEKLGDVQANSSAGFGQRHGKGGGGGGAESGDQDDPLKAMLQQLLSIGLSEDEAHEYVQKLRRALAEMTHPEPPPRELPEELSAEEYWQLAVRYKQVGWTEQARDALTAAIEIDGDGEVGTKARCFLRSKIPRHPVPLMAEQLNIQGYNQMFVNELEAQKIFEQLVDKYADFEWPYGNLGSLLIKRGRLNEARELLMQAVQINPYYINGWLHLSRVYAIEGDLEQAEECLERVIAIDRNDPNWKGIRDLINQLKTDFKE
jgi:tetratricopeptide (TPR) repeat protein